MRSLIAERSQFVFSSELHSGRGLHTTAESRVERPAELVIFSLKMYQTYDFALCKNPYPFQ